MYNIQVFKFLEEKRLVTERLFKNQVFTLLLMVLLMAWPLREGGGGGGGGAALKKKKKFFCLFFPPPPPPPFRYSVNIKPKVPISYIGGIYLQFPFSQYDFFL